VHSVGGRRAALDTAPRFAAVDRVRTDPEEAGRYAGPYGFSAA